MDRQTCSSGTPVFTPPGPDPRDALIEAYRRWSVMILRKPLPSPGELSEAFDTLLRAETQLAGAQLSQHSREVFLGEALDHVGPEGWRPATGEERCSCGRFALVVIGGHPWCGAQGREEPLEGPAAEPLTAVEPLGVGPRTWQDPVKTLYLPAPERVAAPGQPDRANLEWEGGNRVWWARVGSRCVAETWFEPETNLWHWKATWADEVGSGTVVREPGATASLAARHAAERWLMSAGLR